MDDLLICCLSAVRPVVRVSDVVESGSSELKADIEALENRLLQEMEEKQVHFTQQNTKMM